MLLNTILVVKNSTYQWRLFEIICDLCHTVTYASAYSNAHKTYCSRKCCDADNSPHPERRISLSEIKIKLEKEFGDIITIVDESYIKTSALATFVDKDYGEFIAYPKVVVGRKHVHPLRSKKRFALRDAATAKRLTLANIEAKLLQVHKNRVSLKSGQSEPQGNHDKLVFVDNEYGEWKAAIYSVLKGHGHPVRGRLEIFKSSKIAYTLVHWQTQKELTCMGLYEKAFVEWCNINRIEFDWQVPITTEIISKKTGKPHVYYVDAYIRSGEFKDQWIEIKGTWDRKGSELSKMKFEWLKSKFPMNTQLWFQKDLKERGIL